MLFRLAYTYAKGLVRHLEIKTKIELISQVDEKLGVSKTIDLLACSMDSNKAVCLVSIFLSEHKEEKTSTYVV